MRNPSFLVSTPIATILLLLGVATTAITCLALDGAEYGKMSGWSLYKEEYRQNIFEDIYSAETGWIIFQVADGVDLASTHSILAAGAVPIAVAPIVIFILAAGGMKQNLRAWRWYAALAVFFAAGATAASITALVYCMTFESSTVFQGPFQWPTPDDTFRAVLGEPGNGTYSLEGWTCQSQDLFAAGYGRGIASRMCRLSVSPRTSPNIRVGNASESGRHWLTVFVA